MHPALITAIGGGLASAATNIYTTHKLANAYKNNAKKIREAAEKYSGHNADVSMTNAGNIQGQRSAKIALDSNANNVQSSDNAIANAMNSMNNNSIAQSAMAQGQSMGRQMQGAQNAANYNAATMDAQNALNIAQKDYDVANQMVQGGLNSGAQLVKAGKEAGLGTTVSGSEDYATDSSMERYSRGKVIHSDERSKEGYEKSDDFDKSGLNNDSGLPNASLDDAMSKLETITYKYKPEMGLDDEEHVGLVAQSCLKSPLFEDCVVKQDNGYLALDKAKLMSKIPMLISNIEERMNVLRLQSNK